MEQSPVENLKSWPSKKAVLISYSSIHWDTMDMKAIYCDYDRFSTIRKEKSGWGLMI